MKKTIHNIIAVCSVLCLSLLSLVSCKQPYTEKKEVFSPQPQYGRFGYWDSENSIYWNFDVILSPDENGIRVQCQPEHEGFPSDNFFNDTVFGWRDISVTCNGITHNSSPEERPQGYIDFIYPFTSLKCAETFEFKVNYGAPSLTLTCIANGGCGSLVKPSEIDDMEVYIYGSDYNNNIRVQTTLISPNAITHLSDLNGSNFDVTSVYYQIYPVNNDGVDWSICKPGSIDDNNYIWSDFYGGGFSLLKNNLYPIEHDLNVRPSNYMGVYAQYAIKIHPNTSVPEINAVEYEIASINGQSLLN